MCTLDNGFGDERLSLIIDKAFDSEALGEEDKFSANCPITLRQLPTVADKGGVTML
jgi:hypothetical protein